MTTVLPFPQSIQPNPGNSFVLLTVLCIVAPGPPKFLPERCSAEYNTVTLVWAPYSDSLVDAYVLEIDDGCGGNFRVSCYFRSCVLVVCAPYLSNYQLHTLQ